MDGVAVAHQETMKTRNTDTNTASAESTNNNDTAHCSSLQEDAVEDMDDSSLITFNSGTAGVETDRLITDSDTQTTEETAMETDDVGDMMEEHILLMTPSGDNFPSTTATTEITFTEEQLLGSPTDIDDLTAEFQRMPPKGNETPFEDIDWDQRARDFEESLTATDMSQPMEVDNCNESTWETANYHPRSHAAHERCDRLLGEEGVKPFSDDMRAEAVLHWNDCCLSLPADRLRIKARVIRITIDELTVETMERTPEMNFDRHFLTVDSFTRIGETDLVPQTSTATIGSILDIYGLRRKRKFKPMTTEEITSMKHDCMMKPLYRVTSFSVNNKPMTAASVLAAIPCKENNEQKNHQDKTFLMLGRNAEPAIQMKMSEILESLTEETLLDVEGYYAPSFVEEVKHQDTIFFRFNQESHDLFQEAVQKGSKKEMKEHKAKEQLHLFTAIRRISKENAEKVDQLGRTVINNPDEMRAYLRDATIAICSVEHHHIVNQARAVTINTRISEMFHSGENGPRRIGFWISPATYDRLFDGPNHQGRWDKGTILQIKFKNQQYVYSPCAEIVNIHKADNGSVNIRLGMTKSQTEMFDMMITATDSFESNIQATIGPKITKDTRISKIEMHFTNLLEKPETKAMLQKIIGSGSKTKINLWSERLVETKETVLDMSQSKVVNINDFEGALQMTVESPPGSGKTLVSAAIIARDSNKQQRTGKRLVAIAPTNLAVDNIIQTAAENGKGLLRVSRIYSASARERLEDHQLSRCVLYQATHPDIFLKDWMLIHTFATAMEDYQAALTELKKAALVDNLQLRAECFQELKQSEETLVHQWMEAYNPHLIAMTADMALKTPDPHPSKLIVDEASQWEFAGALALLCAWPSISSIVAFGDSKQLPPFTTIKDNSIFHLRHIKGVMSLWTSCETFHQCELTFNYRSHPMIVQQILQPTYPGLRSGITDANRDLAIRKGLPRQHNGAPVLFIDVATRWADYSGTSNVAEGEAAIRLLQRILSQGVQPEQIAVICHHSKQVNLMRDYIGEYVSHDTTDRMAVTTVDGCQGQEYDVVILLTTKAISANTPTHAKAVTLNFVGNPLRANVAASRARHALYVLADWSTMGATPFWAARGKGVASAGGLVTEGWKSINRAYWKPIHLSDTETKQRNLSAQFANHNSRMAYPGRPGLAPGKKPMGHHPLPNSVDAGTSSRKGPSCGSRHNPRNDQVPAAAKRTPAVSRP